MSHAYSDDDFARDEEALHWMLANPTLANATEVVSHAEQKPAPDVFEMRESIEQMLRRYLQDIKNVATPFFCPLCAMPLILQKFSFHCEKHGNFDIYMGLGADRPAFEMKSRR